MIACGASANDQLAQPLAGQDRGGDPVGVGSDRRAALPSHAGPK